MIEGLKRSGRLLPMAQRIFQEEGVPSVLVWIGQITSQWQPLTVNAGRVGVWQISPLLGKKYGLNQNEWIDERLSLEKSTRATARHLKFLAERYAGNWDLAIAAFFSDTTVIDNAITKSGYADFWEIYKRDLLPIQTRDNLPNVLAVILIAQNPSKFGFHTAKDPPLKYDTILLKESVDLRLLAAGCGVPYEYLAGLNPELKRGLTPPILYGLRVPAGTGHLLVDFLQLIPPEKRVNWRVEIARQGDTFATISRRVGISEMALIAVNGGVLKTGQKVLIPQPTAKRRP